MHEQHRDAAAPQGVLSRIAAVGIVQFPSADVRGDAGAEPGEGQMQVLFGHVFPDGVGRGEAAVGEDPVYAVGQVQSRRHQHGRRAHRNPGEVERGHGVPALGQIVDPTLTVEAFEKPEAHIVPAASLLPSLFDEEDVAAVGKPEIVDHREVARPLRTPAVEGDDGALRAVDPEIVPDQPRAVKPLDRDGLVGERGEFFGVLLLFGKDALQFVRTREGFAPLLKLRRVLAVDGEREHQAGDGVGDPRHRGDPRRRGGDRDQDRVPFLSVHFDLLTEFGRLSPASRGCRGRWTASV